MSVIHINLQENAKIHANYPICNNDKTLRKKCIMSVFQLLGSKIVTKTLRKTYFFFFPCLISNCRNAYYKHTIWKKERHFQKHVLGVFMSVLCTKNAKMHGNHTIWEYQTLPKTCLLSVFELLTYQNDKTPIMEKEYHYRKQVF